MYNSRISSHFSGINPERTFILNPGKLQVLTQKETEQRLVFIPAKIQIRNNFCLVQNFEGVSNLQTHEKEIFQNSQTRPVIVGGLITLIIFFFYTV